VNEVITHSPTSFAKPSELKLVATQMSYLHAFTKEFLFKLFFKTNGDVLKSLFLLGQEDFDVDEAFPGVKKYITSLYWSPYNTITKTRWYKKAFIFICALQQHIQQAHYQALVGKNATKPFQQICG
jgi:hypothetical protein